MRNYSLFLIATLIAGCALNSSNIERIGLDYYNKQLSDSSNIKKLKQFFGENGIKIFDFILADNKQVGRLSQVYIDGKYLSYVTNDFNQWTYSLVIEMLNYGFGGYLSTAKEITNVQPLKNGRYFTEVFCGDFTHSSLDSRNDSIVLPIMYMITTATKEQIETLSVEKKFWDCDGYGFGEVIYKKNIKTTATVSSTKIDYVMKSGKNNFTDYDKFGEVVKEALVKGVVEMANDAEMLKAMKDYLLIINSDSIVNKDPKPSESQLTKENELHTINGLDDAKNSCKELGFKIGSKEYGNCVLKLAK